MVIIVTGGAGFIGSALIRHLLDKTGHKIINVDKLTYAGNVQSLKEIEDDPNYEFELTDICSRSKMVEIFERYQPDAIMNLAAESHVDRSIDGPSEFMTTNIMGTFNLLEVSKAYWNNLNKQKKEKFRFLHVSTDEVYGDLEIDEPAFKETNCYEPSSPYSASKASSDHLVRAWGRTYGLPILITNCSNNYGPFQFPEKLIPTIILKALAGEKIPIYGDGKQIRDWLYVLDHVKALVNVLKNGQPGETFNIGGNSEKQNIEVVKTICGFLDELKPREDNKKYQNQIEFVEDRVGHDRRYAVDASKIKCKLGWQPLESFENGMKKTVIWYLGNKQWYENILSGEYKMERLGLKND